MVSLKEKIRSEMKTRPKAWRNIAELVLISEEKLLGMKLRDVSVAAGVSEGSVINFVRSLGYPGFVEFKVALAQSRGEVNPRYAADDGCLSLVLDSAHEALSEAAGLDPSLFGTLAEKLMAARCAVIIGRETSYYISEILAGYLTRIGIVAFAADEPELTSRTLREGDVLVAISYSGETEKILRAVTFAKKSGVYVAAITSFPHSDLSLAADLSLSVGLSESQEGEFPLVARIVELAIIDALCSAIISKKKSKDAESTYNK